MESKVLTLQLPAPPPPVGHFTAVGNVGPTGADTGCLAQAACLACIEPNVRSGQDDHEI